LTTATLVAAWRSRQERLVAVGTGYAVIAALAVLSNAPARWLGDNRYEQYDNPARRLARMFSIWDPYRGFGTVRTEWWPGVTAPLAILRLLGLSPAASLHIWHATLLFLAGLGAVAFFRALVPRIGLAQVVAGLLYMLGPFTVGFLMPSNLYVNYALAPWFFLLFLSGVRVRRPWRSVAAVALLVCAAGTTEVTGLGFTFANFVLIAAYAVHIEQHASWGTVWGWIWRFALLGSLVLAVVAFVSVVGNDGYRQNLRETESPLVINGNSSWAESWRGLGSWLLYHRDQTGLARPQASVFLTSAVTIGASFVAPMLALVGLLTSRRRVALLAGALMLAGLLVMVGRYPLDNPAPYGRFLEWLYDALPSSSVLRNNYKAGAGAMWGIAALAGLGCEALVRRLRAVWARRRFSDRALVSGVALAAVVAVGALSQPFWRTGLYDEPRGYDEVPAYVTDAMAFIDELPGSGRAFFLPRSYRSEFRWGYVNDDVLDASLQRANVIEVPIHLSEEVPADILTALDASLTDRHYRRGTIASLAARLGIEYLVLRNDFEWGIWEQPRPAAFSQLRADPALELLATFGAPGQNTTSPLDSSLEVDIERTLPPIEVYRVRVPTDMARVIPAGPDLLVSGDGSAWPSLAADGWLDQAAPVRFTGGLTTTALREALDNGSPLLITDTNRRQVELITVTGAVSYTLPDGGEFDRPPHLLWKTPGATSIASYGSADRITASSQVAYSGALQPWHRPAAAVDGDPETSWLVGALTNPIGQPFRIELTELTTIDRVTVRAAPPSDIGERVVDFVVVRLDDGTPYELALDDGIGSIDVGGRATRTVEVEIRGIAGGGIGPVGFSEIEIDGLDLAERIVMPDDVVRRAAGDPELAALLADAAVGYRIERLVGDGPVDIERAVRRAFTTPGTATLFGRGRLRASFDLAEGVLARLVGSVITAEASSRFGGQPDLGGFRAVDGDDSTAWTVPAIDGGELTLRFDRRPVDDLGVTLQVGRGLAEPDRIALRVGGRSVDVPVDRHECVGADQCLVALVLPVDAEAVEEIDVVIPRSGDRGVIRVVEVTLDGAPNERLALDQAPAGCFDDVVLLDGRSLAVRILGTVADVISGRAVGFQMCDPIPVGAGRHNVDTGTDLLVDDFMLMPPGMEPAMLATRSSDVSFASIITSGQTSFGIAVDAPGGGTLVLAQSWHPAWRASLAGHDLGKPLEVDGFVGWRLPPGTSGLVAVELGTQQRYEVALLMTGCGVALCVAILLRRPRKAAR
jgi:arabinofuranan 3-O-arabinosyltransferase